MRSFSRRHHWKEHHWNILIHEKILDHHIEFRAMIEQIIFLNVRFCFRCGCQMRAWGDHELWWGWIDFRGGSHALKRSYDWSTCKILLQKLYKLLFVYNKEKISRILFSEHWDLRFDHRRISWREYFYESPRTLNFRSRKYWHFLELAAESSSKFTKIKISNIRIEKLS